MPSGLLSLLRPELVDLRAYAPMDHAGISIRLDANEAPRCSSEHIREIVLEAIAAVPFERYPDATATALKEQIAARTGARPEELLLGSGSDEVISCLACALARPRPSIPQPTVVSPTPTFVMYRTTCRGHGFKPIEVPLDSAWDINVAAMKKAIDLVEPNIIFIASPNNPTSNRMSEGRLREIIEGAPNTLVVLDEAYVDYSGPSLRSLRSTYTNLAILRTLSKVGLAAFRIGWLEAGEELVRELDKVRQPFNVSTTSQVAAAAVLSKGWAEIQAHVDLVVRERSRVTAAIESLPGFEVTPSEANFLWVKTPKSAQMVYESLLRKGILVRQFHSMGGRMTERLRITLGLPNENDRLLEALNL